MPDASRAFPWRYGNRCLHSQRCSQRCGGSASSPPAHVLLISSAQPILQRPGRDQPFWREDRTSGQIAPKAEMALAVAGNFDAPGMREFTLKETLYPLVQAGNTR